MYTAIRASANSAAATVRNALEADPLLGPRFDPGQGGLMRVSLLTPQEMADQNIDGLSVFVYQIVVDDYSRNRPPERVPLNGERPPPLPLRLRVLFTPVVFNLDPLFAPSVEHEIIGKVIETWHSQPFLRGAALLDELAGTDTELAMRIEPLDIESISRIWDALEESFQLCVSYELSIVEIASALAELPVAPVANIALPVGLIAAGERAMTDRFIEVGGVLRRVSYPPDPGIAERLGLVWQARFIDETDGEPVRTRVRVASESGLAAASAERGGQAGLVGTPAKAWPLLPASPVPIEVQAEAEGYLPVQLAGVITAHPNHPAAFDPATPPGPVEMQNLPVRLEGRVRRRTPGGLVPVAGATVALTGIWPFAPQGGAVPAVDPAEVVEIRPPLTAPAAAGTNVRRVALNVPVSGIDTTLAESAPAGATELFLESRAGLGMFLMLEPAHPDRVEIVRIAAVAPLPPAPLRGRVTLSGPLALAHAEGAPVSGRTVTASGPNPTLSRDCIPGGSSLFVSAAAGLTSSGFLRVGTGAAAQIRRVRAYQVVTDAEGYYRLPPIHRIARGFIDAGDGTSALPGIPWVPRRDGPVDRLDLELPP